MGRTGSLGPVQSRGIAARTAINVGGNIERNKKGRRLARTAADGPGNVRLCLPTGPLEPDAERDSIVMMVMVVVVMSRIDNDRPNGGVRTGVVHDLWCVVRNDRGIIRGAITVAVSVVVTTV